MDETEINFTYNMTIMISDKPPQKHSASLNDIIYEDVLIRFYDNLDYAKDFVNDGKIYMRALDAMRTLESQRVDPSEALAQQMFIDKTKFSCIQDAIPIANGTLGLMPIPDIIPVDLEPKCKNIFVFCMSYLKIRNKNDLILDNIKKLLKRNYKIEKYAVIITDTMEYLNRLKHGVESKFSGNHISLGLIDYKERTPFDYLGFQDGDLLFRSLCFQKDIRFQKEHEFRAAIIDKSKNEKGYFVNIGNCEDIALIIDLNV